MKAFHTLSLAAALLATPTIALSGASEPPLVGSVAPVTIALVFSYTGQNTFVKDDNGKVISPPTPTFSNYWEIETATKRESTHEYLSKIKTVKFGNKEFLQKLIDSGVLAAESIAGWSIVQVTPSYQIPPIFAEAGDSQFFAVHAGQPAVNISENLAGMELAGAFTWTYKYTEKGPVDDPEGAVKTVSDVESSKATVALNLNFPSPEVTLIGPPEPEPPYASLQGLFTASQKVTSIGTGANKRPLVLIGAQKLSLITGVGPDLLDEGYDDEPSVVEGTITIGPGKGVPDVTTPYGLTQPPDA